VAKRNGPFEASLLVLMTENIPRISRNRYYHASCRNTVNDLDIDTYSVVRWKYGLEKHKAL